MLETGTFICDVKLDFGVYYCKHKIRYFVLMVMVGVFLKTALKEFKNHNYISSKNKFKHFWPTWINL